MTSDELEVSDSSPRIRKMFCSLGEVSRSDGSAVLSQGGTTVVCGVYGPAEVRTRQTGDVVDRAAVEVVLRPRLGQAQVQDKAREARVVSSVRAAILTVLHPRTSFSVNLQEMEDDGCLEAACVNASCLALLDASVSLKFLLAAVTVVVTAEGDLLTDPTSKQLSRSAASLLFVFSSRTSGEGGPLLVSSYTEGRVTPARLQESLAAAHTASQKIFDFYRSSIAKKFSKEINS